MSASLEPASASVPATDPASGRPQRWRVAVIGLVAVLAVAIGLAAGSFLVTTWAAALGSARIVGVGWEEDGLVVQRSVLLIR
jgi:hypothetical protein